MGSTSVVVWCIVGIILVAAAVAVVLHLYWQYEKRKVYGRTEVTRYLARYGAQRRLPYKAVTTFRPLPEPNDLFKAWYQALVGAQQHVVFATYLWNFHMGRTPNLTKVHPHMYLIGEALRELDSRLDHPVPFHVLVNRSRWRLSEEFIREQWEHTLFLWQEKMGIKLKQVQLQVRAWTHSALNNIHSKFLVVDDREVVITSANCEAESHGGPDSWYEASAWVTDVEAARTCREFVETYWEQAEPLVNLVSKPYPEHETRALSWQDRHGDELGLEQLKDELPSWSQVPLHISLDHAKLSVYRTDHLESNITTDLLTLILRATETVHILTPTFNNPAVYNAITHQCSRYPALRVRIMMGHEFNVDAPFVQKYILGYPVNADFVQDKLEHGQVEWRWYGHNHEKMTINSGRMSHAKLVLVDGRFGKVSCANLDNWSSLTSQEGAWFFEHADIAAYYQTHLVDVLWEQGIPVV